MPKAPTTEIIARGLLIERGHVLLCQNRKHGYHYLPGGHVEFAERARDALARELIEECSLKSRVGPLLLTSEQAFATKKKTHHEINLVFHVEHQPAADTPTGDDGLPTVVSNEPEIDFVWLDLAGVGECDLRPAGFKAWLASGGVMPKETGPFLSGIDESASI